MMAFTSWADQRRSEAIRRIVLTLKTPVGVDTKCSPDRIRNPSHTPSSHRSSNSQTLCWVFGILNMIVSAKFTNLALDRLPFIIW